MHCTSKLGEHLNLFRSNCTSHVLAYCTEIDSAAKTEYPFYLERTLIELISIFPCRDVQGKDFEEWAVNLQSVLQLSDRGPSCLTILRQLYVITAVTKYNRK